MSKLISKNTKRNRLRVKQQLDNEYLSLQFQGMQKINVSAGQALIMGNNLLRDGKPNEASYIADQLCKRFWNVIDVRLLKLKTLMERESLVEAGELVGELFEIAKDNPGVLFAAARLKVMLGDSKTAIKLFHLALRKNPNYLPMQISLAECYQAIGDPDKSERIYRKIISRFSGYKSKNDQDRLDYLAALVNLGGIAELTPDQLLELESVFEEEACSVQQQSQIAFVLARSYEKKKNIDRECKFIKLANKKLAFAVGHDVTTAQFIDEQEKHLDLQREIFSTKRPSFLEGVEANSKLKPIFILGMPRSGTTLMEQMLSAHEMIGQTGESTAFMIALEDVYKKYLCLPDAAGNYPLDINKVPKEGLESIIYHYEKHQKLITTKKIFIDKHLASYRYVGLATSLFSNAKFIHMNRAPMDIFLSCYRGAIPGVPATCNLEHMAALYIYMKKLIGHWKKLFPDKVYIVDYAELVETPEEILKELLDFLNIDFQSQMLEFYSRKNMVRTLSVDQVRQPIYKTSIKKWLPYAELLEPAREALNNFGISEEGVRVL